jgi:predicted small metal-binding protein
MAKIFRCKDVGVSCGWERRAETEEELMSIVVEHAATMHGMKDLSEEVKEKIRKAIRDE